MEEIKTFEEQEKELKESLSKEYDQVLNTEELQNKYEVLGFSYGYVAVRDKETGEKGSFNFTHMPRIYYSYQKDS